MLLKLLMCQQERVEADTQYNGPANSEEVEPDAMAAAAKSKQNSRESRRQLTKDARLRGDEDDMSCLGADMG